MTLRTCSTGKFVVLTSVVLLSLFGLSCSASEIPDFCKVTLQEQADLGSLAEPTQFSIQSKMVEDWASETESALRTRITLDLRDYAFNYFRKNVRSQLGSMEWREVLDIRARQFPVLKEFVQKNKITRTEALIFPRDEVDFLPFLQSMQKTLISKLGKFTRDEFVLPGVFVNKIRADGKRELRIWNFRSDQGTLYQKYETTKAFESRQIDFRLWARILAKYGIQPVALGTNIFIHDFYGHAFAALVHPYEELVLQRHFYEQVVKVMDRVTDAEQTLYVAKILEIANLLFEGFELPKSDALKKIGTFNSAARASIAKMESTNGLLDAEILIANPALVRDWAPFLHEFRRKIVNDDTGFYASAEFYGGDFYDVRNHYLRGNEVRNFSGPEYAYGLEGLRFQSLENPVPLGEEVLRLFVAYYNAEKTGLTFESFVNSAVGARKSGQTATLTPWKDSIEAAYLKSYTKPEFRKVIDGITR